MTHDEAIRMSVAIFAEVYQGRWEPGDATALVWSGLLMDLAPEEILTAAQLWASSEKWPPTPSDLRKLIPRYCRCGRCSSCHRSALDRAKAAIDRGAIGADDFGEKEGLTSDDFKRLESRKLMLAEQAKKLLGRKP